MARQLTSLEPEPTYRAVTFYKHAGMHNLPMETYTDKEGNTYEYHRVSIFGPYEKPSTAKSLLKREERFVDRGYREYYDYNSPNRDSYPVADMQGIIEACTPVWGLHIG